MTQYTPLQHKQQSEWGMGRGEGTYNVCAVVAWNFIPELMLAAAIICTAHPQSIEATDETFSIVLQSVDPGSTSAPIDLSDFWKNLQAAIHAKKCRHFGGEKMNVQKYNPPEVGAAEPSSASERAMHVRKTPHVAH
jgi:hypothetical protein